MALVNELREAYDIKESDKVKIIVLTRALFPEAKIYLFGSRATGTYTRGSDIDIALDMGQKIDFVAVGELREVLNATNIPQKIDVVDFHSVPKDMQQEIMEDKVVWKE